MWGQACVFGWRLHMRLHTWVRGCLLSVATKAALLVRASSASRGAPCRCICCSGCTCVPFSVLLVAELDALAYAEGRTHRDVATCAAAAAWQSCVVSAEGVCRSWLRGCALRDLLLRSSFSARF